MSGKLCVAVGDLFVTPEAMAEGLAPLAEAGYELDVRAFSVGDFDRLQEVNLCVEQHGPGAVELDASLRSRLIEADMIVVHFCPISDSLIAQASRLRHIGTCRTGTSNIDIEAANVRSIGVTHCAGRLAEAVADFTVGLLICEARNIARGHAGLKRGEWIRRYPNLGQIPELPGRTVGLIGLGAIGQATARRLRAFDMRILATDPMVTNPQAEAVGAELVDLDSLLRSSDFVSIHVGLNDQTRGLIGRRELDRMRPTAYLINTARAGVVDEEALIAKLQAGELAGAGLDVFATEPPGPDHPLVQLENVTLTPHMAGGADDAFRKSPHLLCRYLLASLG
jgi:D-3-phosphoglycerate dehydrogenase / 2-oxoglutarate reductase